MKENNKIWLRYIICFGLIAILCYLFPYTGDDWAWGSKIGVDRLNNWFENYNGRYVGNLIVLAMTRSNLLKAVIMSFCLTGIVALCEYIFKKKMGFYVSCVALVLIPKLIFSSGRCMDGRLCKLRNLNVFHIVIYSVCLSYFSGDNATKKKFGIVCRSLC